MRAVYINNPKDVEIKEITLPKPKKGEALLKILYGGICGSDLASYNGTFAYFDYPRIPGHEFSAEIAEIGENEQGFKKGMIVTCNPYYNCGSCNSCKKGLVNACMDNKTMGCQKDGAFSTYITMPISRIYDGKGLSAKKLALVEPLCISYHGAKKAAIKKGDKVLVVGAGTIGVLAAAVAKQMGADVYIADVLKDKLDYAKNTFGLSGAILSTSAEELQEATEQITGFAEFNGVKVANGFDVCIEAVGLPSTFQNCIDSARFGGSVVLIGVGKKNLDFNFTIIQKKELKIYGSRNATKEDFDECIDFMQKSESVEKIVTHTYKFDDVKQAFKDFESPKDVMLKVLIDFTGE